MLAGLALALVACEPPSTAAPAAPTSAPSPPPSSAAPPSIPTATTTRTATTTFVHRTHRYRIDVPTGWTIRRGNVLDPDAPGLAPLDELPTVEWRVGDATDAALSIHTDPRPRDISLREIVERGHRDRSWLGALTDTTLAGRPALSLVSGEGTTIWIDAGDFVVSIVATTRAGASEGEVHAALDSLRFD